MGRLKDASFIEGRDSVRPVNTPVSTSGIAAVYDSWPLIIAGLVGASVGASIVWRKRPGEKDAPAGKNEVVLQRCTQCRGQMPLGAEFCGKCGSRIKG